MGDYQVPRTEIQPVTRLVHEDVHQVRLPFECLAYHLRILSRIDAVSRSFLLGRVWILWLTFAISARLPIMHLERESSMSTHDTE